MSNGRFKSVEHRAVTNRSTLRIAVPTFYAPSNDAFIAPATTMMDEQQPALYRGYHFEEYLGAFWGQALNGKSVLDRFKINEH